MWWVSAGKPVQIPACKEALVTIGVCISSLLPSWYVRDSHHASDSMCMYLNYSMNHRFHSHLGTFYDPRLRT